MSLQTAAEEFLAQKRIAVTGVSQKPAGHGSNAVYQRLRKRGYSVFAVNPNAETVEGDVAYPDLASIPGGVDGVVIGTKPERADATVGECHELGIPRVWMHRGFGEGSVSESAAEYCREHDIAVIAGACPLMYGPASDFGHKCMRWALGVSGKLPKP